MSCGLCGERYKVGEHILLKTVLLDPKNASKTSFFKGFPVEHQHASHSDFDSDYVLDFIRRTYTSGKMEKTPYINATLFNLGIIDQNGKVVNPKPLPNG